MMFLGFVDIKFKVGIEGYFATGDFLIRMETYQVITLEKKMCIFSCVWGNLDGVFYELELCVQLNCL